MSDDEFDGAISWQHRDEGQSSGYASMAQQLIDIHDRLTRIKRRIATVHTAFAHLGEQLVATMHQQDHFAGDDTPFGGDETGYESNN